MKSWMAEPSRRNSGLEQTANSPSGRAARRRRSISRLVPTGTVDFVTIDREALQVRRDLLDRGIDVGQVGVAVAAAHRRADGEQDDVGLLGGRPEIVGEDEAAGLHVALDEIVEARLVDRRLAVLELGERAADPCRRR